MKTAKYIILLAFLWMVAACEKDETKVYIKSYEPGELMATASSVVLTPENADDIVLSLAWTKNALETSDPNYSVADDVIQIMQSSLTEDFSGTVNESTETSMSKAYTGATLNTLAKNVGAVEDVENRIYFRLSSQVGTNIDPVFSNVVAVDVTPYAIDMSVAYILDTGKSATGVTLYSAESDGDYLGFMGATSWYNFYMQEGDGTIWGNDGVTGTPFLMSSDESTQWNFWFPAPGGCYYVDMNTNTARWSSLYIPSLTLEGDLSGTMTYDRPNNQWSYVFEAASAGSFTFTVSGTGALYDYSTDTDDDSAISTPVAFAQEGDHLTFGSSAGSITLTAPATGECSLVIDLSDPTNWTAEIVSGSAAPAPVNEFVYMVGISDGYGDWTFDKYLRLYDEDNLGYAGCADVDCPWGYQIAIEKDNWSDVYYMEEGDAYSGTLSFGSGDNIPAADLTGLHFFNVSLKNLTYNVVAVSEVYYSGFNDDWGLYAMTSTGEAGVYTATVEITADTPWGFEIVLDYNWATELGGEDGKLLYKSGSVGNIPFDGAVGTYTLTVDLIASTYTIE
ncbi:MAG: DUF5114 domain-containing protein [Bacteroidales bacterium]|nr:DUF5114 domain-containing protein [Bacteroidales bacterium]